MDFKDQYKHPLWQKKRLEALEKAGFVCERCYDDESQLHIHHKRYIKGRMIWDYPVEELAVLCDSCHQEAHAEKDYLQSILARLHPEASNDILSLLAGYCYYVYGPAGVDLTGDPMLERVGEYSFTVGRIAALASNISSLDAIKGMVESLERAQKL